MDSQIEFPTIAIATRNKHKLVELRRMFGLPESKALSAADYPGMEEPDENGDTFEENALIKARAMCEFTGHWTIADDSGLEVDALGGAPGVHSARYAGKHGDDAANNSLLLEKLASPGLPRTAHFTCAMALVAPDGREYTVNGICPGRILHSGRGDNGFGYDPLFLPDGHDKTFAELPTETKCLFSHRAVAAEKMRAIMQSLFGKQPEPTSPTTR